MIKLISTFVCLIVILTLTVANAAYAEPFLPWIPSLNLTQTLPQLDKKLMTQLETEVLPQLEKILTPEQLEKFDISVTSGTSFRKAFKSLMLTPTQKTQLKTLFKSVSKKDAFASLSPEQKKQLFLKKKEMFMPTSEEIIDKINTKVKDKGTTLPEGVKEKIEAGIKKKDAFAPTPESITEKISAGMNMLKEKMSD